MVPYNCFWNLFQAVQMEQMDGWINIKLFFKILTDYCMEPLLSVILTQSAMRGKAPTVISEPQTRDGPPPSPLSRFFLHCCHVANPSSHWVAKSMTQKRSCQNSANTAIHTTIPQPYAGARSRHP